MSAEHELVSLLRVFGSHATQWALAHEKPVSQESGPSNLRTKKLGSEGAQNDEKPG